jgi:hypothetical protein
MHTGLFTIINYVCLCLPVSLRGSMQTAAGDGQDRLRGENIGYQKIIEKKIIWLGV